MATLSAPKITPSNSGRTSLFSLGESALRLMLVAALPISAMIFAVQTF